MSKIKPKRIVKHGCYSASNKDLRIKDRNGKLMGGEHDVFVVSKPSAKGFVKVKTITSLENVRKDGTSKFHDSALSDVKSGKIIPIPDKQINSKKLSGIYKKGIWIHKSKLFKKNHNLKFPKKYKTII